MVAAAFGDEGVGVPETGRGGLMAAVEWTRLAPETVEQLVAVLLYADTRTAVRIRPSRGDGGIDIKVPNGAGFDIYQVKSFTANLKQKQKDQIERSYQRLRKWADDQGMTVTSWNLMMPLDPTNENETWLAEVTSPAPFPVVWHGLNAVEFLAGRHPELVDYLIHDGKERLDKSIRELLAVIRTQNNAKSAAKANSALTVRETTADLSACYAAVNRADPFYRYDLRFTQDRPPLPPPQTDLYVASEQLQTPDGWMTIDIYQEFVEAPNEKPPVKVEVQIALQAGSTAHDEWTSFLKYGSPVSMPPGTVTGNVQMPGGLGGDITSASLTISPAPTGEPARPTRLQVLDPDGTVIATSRINVEPATSGPSGHGVRARALEQHGVFELESRTELPTGHTTFTFTRNVLSDMIPADLVEPLRTLANLHHPNRCRFVALAGPAHDDGLPIPQENPVVDVSAELALAEALVTIQEHTTSQLRYPHDLDADETILAAAHLLRGGTVPATWERFSFTTHRDKIDELRERLTRRPPVRSFSPLRLRIGDEIVDLGLYQVTRLSARLQSMEVDAASEGVTVQVVPGDHDEVTVVWVAPENMPTDPHVVGVG